MNRKKKKYVFISNMASPYQVKFCYALNEYFETEFWFYVKRESNRPKWWEIPLGDKCKIMKASGILPKIGYFSLGLFIDLVRFKPDIVVLGGFMKWHILVLYFSKLLGSKVVIMSEPLRYVTNDEDGSTELMTKKNSPKKVELLKILFNKVDLYNGMGEVANKQFVEEFDFPKNKVTDLPYPQDIEEYFNHPLREKKMGDSITLLFANRLVERYQPLLALRVFHSISSKYPNLRMLMNSDGPQEFDCHQFVEDNCLNVEFLNEIESWNDMHLIYKISDILILPASYSNGNMTITEAKASGMGMVLSNRINSVEINNRNNENCYICEPDFESLLEAVEKYIRKPELLFIHGKCGRTLVEEKRNYSTAKKYFDTFREHGFID